MNKINFPALIGSVLLFCYTSHAQTQNDFSKQPSISVEKVGGSTMFRGKPFYNSTFDVKRNAETGISYEPDLLAFIDNFDNPNEGVIFNGFARESINFINPDSIALNAVKTDLQAPGAIALAAKEITNRVFANYTQNIGNNFFSFSKSTRLFSTTFNGIECNNGIYNASTRHYINGSEYCSQNLVNIDSFREAGLFSMFDTVTGLGFSNIFFGRRNPSNQIVDLARVSVGDQTGEVAIHAYCKTDTIEGHGDGNGYFITNSYVQLHRHGFGSVGDTAQKFLIDTTGFSLINRGDTLLQIDKNINVSTFKTQVAIVDGTQAVNKILMSDAAGKASWKTLNALLSTLPSFANDAAAALSVSPKVDVGDSYYNTTIHAYTRRER